MDPAVVAHGAEHQDGGGPAAAVAQEGPPLHRPLLPGQLLGQTEGRGNPHHGQLRGHASRSLNQIQLLCAASGAIEGGSAIVQ